MKKILHIILSISVILCISCITAFAEDDPDTYYLELDSAGGQIDGESVTEISAPKDSFDTVDLSSYTPVQDGFTFTGWYNGKKEVTSISASDFTSGSNRIKLLATYTKDDYSGSGLTFTLNANGGKLNDQDAGTYDFAVAGNGYAVALNAYVPVREGYDFKGWCTSADGSGTPVNLIYTSTFTKAEDNGLQYDDIDGSADKRNITFYASWASQNGPSGKICIGKKSWNGLQGNVSFDTYYKKNQTVNISCSDPDASIEYLVTDQAMSEDALKSADMNAYAGAFDLDGDGSYIVYVRFTLGDKTTFASTPGIVIDSEAPVISGIDDGGVYCKTATMTVTDENLSKVTIDGTDKKPDANGSLKLAATGTARTIVATDKAGNSTSISVTVNKKHTPEADDGNCTTALHCKYCDAIVKAAKDNHNLSKWKTDGNGSTHSRKCLNAGCGYTVIQDCYGGKATCSKKAECIICGAEYGSLNPNNHSGLQKFNRVEATASSDGNIEYWYCPSCGKYFKDQACSTEISKDDTVISKSSPDIIGGKGSRWKKSSKDTVKFRSNANYEDFICVLVDGKELDSSYYTKKEGSIIIEIKASFLETLSIGNHSLIIRSTTGDAVTDFYVDKADSTTTAPMVTTQQTTTQATTQTTTEATTQTTTRYVYAPTTSEPTTFAEITTRAHSTSENTTEVTTEKSSRHIGNYSSVDKTKNKVHNLQLVILITVLATILISFAIILISGMRKK